MARYLKNWIATYIVGEVFLDDFVGQSVNLCIFMVLQCFDFIQTFN